MTLLLRLPPLTAYRLGNGSIGIERDDGGEVNDDEVAEALRAMEAREERRHSPAATPISSKCGMSENFSSFQSPSPSQSPPHRSA